MERQVLGELEVRYPARTLETRLRELLAGRKIELEVPFETLGFPAMGKLSRQAKITLGTSSRRSDGATLVPIHWKDARSLNFPEFEGCIEITPLSSNDSQIAIIGEYTPLLGIVGAAFDAMIGKRIAEVSVEQLLERLRSLLESK